MVKVKLSMMPKRRLIETAEKFKLHVLAIAYKVEIINVILSLMYHLNLSYFRVFSCMVNPSNLKNKTERLASIQYQFN